MAFRWATVIGGLVPLLVSQFVMRMEFAEAVALVFALAASTFCPLLVLGIWWRRLTAFVGDPLAVNVRFDSFQ